MKLSFLFDKDLIQSFLLSIISFIYSKFILFIITHVQDKSLMYLVNPYIYKKNVDDLSDSDSSDSEDTILNNQTVNDISNHNTLEEYNNYIRLWEYDIILHLFKLERYSFNIISPNEKNKVNYIQPVNSILKLPKELINSIVIVNCFLFNIQVSKVGLNLINKASDSNIKLLSMYPFQYKLALFSYISNNYINSSVLHNLFPKHKYIYIYYKKNSKYEHVLIDLYNNYDVIKHKKILFNKINIK